MIHKGQRFRKVGARGIWVVLGPRQNLLGQPDEHQGQWFMAQEGGGKVEAILDLELESGTNWTLVPDDA